MDKPELKPCPFCGSTDVKIEENSIEYEDGEIEEDWLIECHGCGSAFIASNAGMPCTKDELIARWNRRADNQLSVGDKVYQTDGVRVYESSIRRILYETEGITFDVSAIGQSIFLTNKEAEEKAEHYGTT